MKLPGLRTWRERRGLSQQALSDLAGVSRDGISHYETGTREAHPNTAKKLAEALEVEVTDLAEKKMEVEVGSVDEDTGVYRGEILRFTGELVDSYEHGDRRVELYRCPDGYRVYVDDDSKPERTLFPFEANRYTGELVYPLYSAEEVAEEWPEFGSSVGVLRVRDID